MTEFLQTHSTQPSSTSGLSGVLLSSGTNLVGKLDSTTGSWFGTLSTIESLGGVKSVTGKWVRGEISNFEYVMHLNTLAGRSYNDLMQYPVFPWVLADYCTSERPSLTSPGSFRDLSRPMGAQLHDAVSVERCEKFKRRYRDWDEQAAAGYMNSDDGAGESNAYHYATHYSSAMIVCSFLVRMEPFAQNFLSLQVWVLSYLF